MAVLGVVRERLATTLRKVDERQQSVLHSQLVEDQRELVGHVHGEENLHEGSLALLVEEQALARALERPCLELAFELLEEASTDNGAQAVVLHAALQGHAALV